MQRKLSPDCFWFKFPNDPKAPIKSVDQAMQEALAKMQLRVPTNPETHKAKGTPL